VIIQLPPQSNQSPVSATPIRDTEKLSKSVARQDFASTELERRRQRQALPLLADRLIGEIVQQVFGEITADLLRTAKQVAAARTCAKAKTRRKENILLWSEWTYQVLRAEAIHRILEEAVLGEVRRRFLVRRAIRRWRDWASRTREAREIAFKEREETFDRLRSMGLGEALSFGDASMPAGPSDPAKSKGPLDEFEVDIALQQVSPRSSLRHLADDLHAQAQRTTSLLHAPSTFLAAIEQHIAPHFSPSTSSIASTFSANSSRNDGHAWHTLISPASDSACAPDATDWLISKFIPESSEQHEQDMMSFETTVVGRYDELPCSHDVGLVVFEASLRTWASHKASEWVLWLTLEMRADILCWDRNITDAQDRMAVLVKTATRLENRYTPGFIILTWEDETLQEVVERLDIADDVALFEHKTILSLEYSEDLDVRFDKALEEVILGFHEKERIVLRHQDVMSRLFPSWERLLEASSLVLEQRPTDAHSALRVFKAGIEGIKVVARIIVDGLSKKVVIASSFHSISLQDFTDSSPSDMHTAVEAIDGYLHKELFQGLDDVSLILAPLHQAALQSKRACHLFSNIRVG